MRCRSSLLRVFAPALLALVGGCATAPPELGETPTDALELAAARAAPERFAGRAARWGGEILGVETLATRTRFEVLALPLHETGEPVPDSAGEGRFVAYVDGFLDPAVYRPGRDLTLIGAFSQIEHGQVGEHSYAYPVLIASRHYLWPEEPRHYARDVDVHIGVGYGFYPFYFWAFDPFLWPYHHHGHHHRHHRHR
ncbi:MAG: Slp/YeaY family lipoprotein [Chromatiales bacterium]|nr:Slp/YeaY family lipoprotein [Chromatiales bacterium]